MGLVNSILYFLHVVAVVFWIGGIGYILFVLMPAMPRVSLHDRATFMPALLRRFLVVVWTAIGLLILTGLYRMFFVWDITQPGFFSGPLGYSLTAKLILAAALFAIALLVSFRTVPRATTHVSTHLQDSCDTYKCAQCGEIIGGMRRVLQAALVVALAVIYAAVELRGA